MMFSEMSEERGCRICEELSPQVPAVVRYPAAVAADERERQERILGCLLGGAIGDAVGRLVRSGVEVPAQPKPGSLLVGGATQLSLFTAEGMVRMLVRFYAKGIGPAWDVLKHAYDRWLFTQHYNGDAAVLRDRWGWGAGSGWPDGWLVREHSLHVRRSTMATTVRALRRAEASQLGDDRRLHPRPNTSKGSGALVRVAPAGLLVREDFAFEMGVRCAGYTHGHPEAFLSAGLQSRLVAALLAGRKPDEILAEIRGDLIGWPGATPFYKYLDAIGVADPNATASLSAARALVLGARSALGGGAALETVLEAAREGGTAAAVVAGQLIGVMQGSTAWPDPWRRSTDVSPVIAELAQAVSVAHRAWMMDRRIPGAEWQTEDIFEEHPVSMLLWPRFPGW
jgi:hypothetical protein